MRFLDHVQISSLYFLLPLNPLSFRYKTFFMQRFSVQNDRDADVERMSIVSE